MINPILYEINTRVWIKKFDQPGQPARLDTIPANVWDEFANKGFDILWLMGIWKTSSSIVKKYCFKDFLCRSYDKALKDWQEDDVIGSPYAIEMYEVNPVLGNKKSLLQLKQQLNERGIRLFLDFVPNHLSAGSRLIDSNPEIFLQADDEIFQRDSHTYFRAEGSSRIFAHGRDPFFPAWEDTIQINYFSPTAREFMNNTLLDIASCCDGLRCDMAMLLLDNVFFNTWRGTLNKMGFEKPAENFWKSAIKKVKEKYPDFIFMAESYWDLEWELQQAGFDYTYDKRLTDRLASGQVKDIHDHLLAGKDYQVKSVRFIENHDEERSYSLLGKNKSQAAAVIIGTIQGMRFFHDGQFDGKKIKLPVQLGREPIEHPVLCIKEFYDKLLTIIKDDIFKHGDWQLAEILPAWADDLTFENMLAWTWCYNSESRLVVVNYSDIHSHCRIKLDVRGYEDNFQISDLLHDTVYIRSAEEVFHQGLYIDLRAYQCHIFKF